MVAETDWTSWLARNRASMEASKTPYEWTFANRILCRVSGLSPDSVQVQVPFTDLDGGSRRMDFAVVEGRMRVAVEVDGYNKVPGTSTGMTKDEFSAFLRRQTALSAQGWMVLRFANSDFTQNPSRCIRQIELALQQAAAEVGDAPELSSDDRVELDRLRRESNDIEALKEQLKKTRVEADSAHRKQRWLAVGVVAAILAAGATGLLYATRERLPGVSPDSATTCPSDHPIKGNRSQSSNAKIYHIPGGFFYDRTTPIRCFASQDEAVAAGYRRSAR